MTADELNDLLAEQLSLPKSSESDGQRAEAHSLSESIKAAKFLAANRANKGSAWKRISKVQGITPGTEPK